MMHTEIDNPFRKFWDLGYRSLIPVVPPGAEISPQSNLSPSSRGKTPGVRGRDGLWRGANMHNIYADESDLDAWFAWGAGVGMRGGDDLFFVDVDHMDSVASKRLYQIAKAHLGPSWPRVGRAPKFALPYRSTSLIKSTAIKFDCDPVEGAEPGLDIISTTPHCVVAGIHATTGQPYDWPKGIPAYDALTEVTPEQVEAFLAAVEAEFPIRAKSTPTSREIPENQESLRGDPEVLRRAMRDLPNPSEKFPERKDYIRIGIALKAGFGPEHEEEALDLYQQWAGRWDSTVKQNHHLTVERDWARFKPPFSIGADHIYNKAELLTDWERPTELQIQRALDYFEPQELEGAPQQHAEPTRTSTFQPLSVLQGLEVPTRDWVVPDLIPDKTVTMLSGDGGTGKSLLAQQLAVAAVLGKDWLGNAVKQGPVLVISAEDDAEELHRRFAAILAHNEATFQQMDGLVFRSLAGEDAVLGAVTGKAGLLKPTPLFAEVEAEALRLKPVLIVLDTLADLFGGSEIDRVQTRQFVGILRGLAIRCECAALLLSHPSVAGMQSGSGTSGSTAWNASVRSRLYLERIVEDGVEPNPDARRLTTKKANYARTGGSIGLRWADGAFVVDETAAGPMAGVEASAKAQAVFLKSLQKFSEQGRFVSANHGPTFAPAIFAKAGASGMTKKALTSAMETLLSAGRIKVEKHGKAGRERSHLVISDPFDRIGGEDASDTTSGSDGSEGGVFN
jgi:RecA-family ATPase